MLFKYPLNPIPLSLANADGTRRETTKSVISKIIREFLPSNNYSPTVQEKGTYIIDFIAQLRTMRNISETCEQLSWNFVKMVPHEYSRVDLVADTCMKNSIKSSERLKRGVSAKIIITSSKSKIPRDFQMFMMNGENNSRLIQIVFEFIVENKVKLLNALRTTRIYLIVIY